MEGLKAFWQDFRHNRGACLGLVVIVFFLLLSSLPLWTNALDPEALSSSLRLPPAWAEGGQKNHWLGTDDLGRDMLARLIHGARISLGIGAAVVGIALILGIGLGLATGVYGGWLDRIVMRAIDILMSMPSILLCIVVVAVLGPGLVNAILAVSLIMTLKITRVVRSSVLGEMKKQYVTAAQSFGASRPRLMLSEILPNCMGPIIVQGTLGFSDAILDTAALGFLGLGARAPLSEWGTMLADARPFLESSPWMVVLPGTCILLVVLGFNLLGDGLNDALDPKMRR